MNNMQDNLWKEISDIFTNSQKDLVINSIETKNGEEALNILQITAKSALGAIVLNTSGIIICNWIRILGHNSKTNRGILSYNLIGKDGIAKKIDKMLIVADDIIGGTFALNAGKFFNGIGHIWYFAPDTLEWECLDITYSEFIAWIAQGNIEDFYKTMRWSTWKEECKNISFNDSILIYPFLWSKEVNLEKGDKTIVPAEELLDMNLEFSIKINEEFKLD